MTLNSVTLTTSTSTNEGGAIYVKGTSFTLNSDGFTTTDNTATSASGGLFYIEGTTTAIDVQNCNH